MQIMIKSTKILVAFNKIFSLEVFFILFGVEFLSEKFIFNISCV